LRLVRLFALMVAFQCWRKYKHAAALIATGTAICYLRPVNRHCLAQLFFYPGVLMDKEEISRRIFLIRSCAGVSAACLAARWPEVLAAGQHVREAAKSEREVEFEFFTAEQALEIEAIAAQIIPTDDTPGAREARVIYFIDRAFVTFDKDKQPHYEKGLAALRAKAKNKFSGLSSARQTKLLKGIQLTGFFQQVRTHT